MARAKLVLMISSLALALGAGPAVTAVAAPPVPEDAATDNPTGTTPPRLSYTEGSVSFWRPGAEDWTPAQINTALAAGDRLYANGDANLEVEFGDRCYLRADDGTQVGVANLEPDFVQIQVDTGRITLDVRDLDAGHTFEIDTPNAAFTIEQNGMYRVDVSGDATTFTTRRAGRAIVTPAGGQSASVSPSEQVVVQGSDIATVATYVAPDLDSWDKWNYQRTDRLLDSLSARYVAPNIAGTADLDHHGRWRVVPTYGAVWIPTGVAVGWAPYSTGHWVWDPFYSWTWVDDAPWGWAPYHYGRWVYLDGYWGWAPGPLVVRAVYAPALVAFFGGPYFGVSLGFGPAVGWVSLGWGEPCWPWWGPRHFRHNPWWGGWHGPHHYDDHHHHYRNTDVPRAVIAEPQEAFGHRHGKRGRIDEFRDDSAEAVHGDLPVRVTPASLVPGTGAGVRPPKSADRSVIGTRLPHDSARELREAGLQVPGDRGKKSPPARVIEAPVRGPGKTAGGEAVELRRPPFGKDAGGVRREPPAPPKYVIPKSGFDRGKSKPTRGVETRRERETGPPAIQSPGGGRKPSVGSTGKELTAPPVMQPTQPTHPAQPAHPTQPTRPAQPVHPSQPAQPARPVPPAHPAQPTRPSQPMQPTQPAHPTPGQAPSVVQSPSQGPRVGSPRRAPSVETRRPQAQQQRLPGEPANRVYRGWGSMDRGSSGRGGGTTYHGGSPRGGGATRRSPSRGGR